MTEICQEIQEEVEACITKVKEFQKTKGRRVAKSIKRSQKGFEGLRELEQFGIDLPQDFRALYHHYNGVEANNLSLWESSVFLNFDWLSSQVLVRDNKIKRVDVNPLTDMLYVFGSPLYCLFLGSSQDKTTERPLMISKHPLSRNFYIAFDSTLAFLRSVCAAQEADILKVHSEHKPTNDKEPGEVYYDKKELWDVIKTYNPGSSEYWLAEINNSIEWDEIHIDIPGNGILDLNSELTDIIVGDVSDYQVLAEREMKKSSLAEKEMTKTRNTNKK